jgi:hypothetical protein
VEVQTSDYTHHDIITTKETARNYTESYEMTTKAPENTHTSTPSGRLDLGGLGVGLMQWGTTSIDNNIVNLKGNLTEADVRSIWESCRQHNIVFFDTAEGMSREVLF